MSNRFAAETASLDVMPDNPGERRPMPGPAKAQARRIDQPRAGFFLVRLVKGGPRVPARIVEDFGLFSAEIDGKPCGAADSDPLKADGVMRVWHYGTEIERTEYRTLLGQPDRPDPRKPVNLAAMKPVF